MTICRGKWFLSVSSKCPKDFWRLLWINVENESVVYLSATQNQSQEVVDAKETELASMQNNKLYEIVPYENQTPVMIARWVIT